MLSLISDGLERTSLATTSPSVNSLIWFVGRFYKALVNAFLATLIAIFLGAFTGVIGSPSLLISEN
jgi:hypothetical protein